TALQKAFQVAVFYKKSALQRLRRCVLPIGKTGLPRFELRSNLAMTLFFVSGCLKAYILTKNTVQAA
ncbi:MAG: hypothetical protein J6W29_00545, partial [Neisseriaceae bacterium]|nr:hypothetical protein [Neisseriaceae bacterium]